MEKLTPFLPLCKWEKSILVVGSGTIPGSDVTARICDMASKNSSVLNTVIFKAPQKLKNIQFF